MYVVVCMCVSIYIHLYVYICEYIYISVCTTGINRSGTRTSFGTLDSVWVCVPRVLPVPRGPLVN